MDKGNRSLLNVDRKSRTFYTAVVVEVFPDPDDLDHVAAFRKKVTSQDSYLLASMPKNSIIAHVEILNSNKVIYPFFPQHFSLPLIPGDHVWVMFPGGISESIEGYYFCKKSSKIFSDDLNHFGFFGKVSELKGIIILLQAIYKLKQQIHTPFFVHINGGGLEQQPVLIQTRVRNLLRACGDRVNLNGAYQQDQIPDLMRQCDWVVVPSIWWENSPVVIQEAFACQRPVLGTDHGGIHEKIVDKGGIGFSCGDSSSLAACMQSALGNQMLHTKLRREIQPRTTASICADHHLKLYNSLLGTNK